MHNGCHPHQSFWTTWRNSIGWNYKAIGDRKVSGGSMWYVIPSLEDGGRGRGRPNKFRALAFFPICLKDSMFCSIWCSKMKPHYKKRQVAVQRSANLQELVVPKPNKRDACKCYTYLPNKLNIELIMNNESCQMDFGVVICNNTISVIRTLRLTMLDVNQFNYAFNVLLLSLLSVLTQPAFSAIINEAHLMRLPCREEEERWQM